MNATYFSGNIGGPQREVDVAIMEAIIIPRIESRLSDALLPVVFQRCNATDADNLSLDVVGISEEPDDVIVEGIGTCWIEWNFVLLFSRLFTEFCVCESYLHSLECNSIVPPNAVCYPIDGEMSIFFETTSNTLSRRLQQTEQAMSTLNENVQEIFNSGKLNDAHPAMVGTASTIIIVNPIFGGLPPAPTIGVVGSSASNWWVFVLIIAGGGLLIALILVAYQEFKNSREQTDADADAVERITMNVRVEADMN